MNDLAKKRQNDRSNNTIEVDKTKLNVATELFTSFGDHATEAAQRYAQMTWETIQDYDGGFDSDTSSDDKNKPKSKIVFDLEMLFQLTPIIAGTGGMDDQNSIGTNQTGLTDATTQILEEATSTKFDKIIELENCTVTSGITEPTTTEGTSIN